MVGDVAGGVMVGDVAGGVLWSVMWQEVYDQ